MDFCLGGNGVEDPQLCGPDEVYVDALIDPSQWAFIAYHEIFEAKEMKRLMAEGMSRDDAYDKAHARANAGEKALRERHA